MVNFDLFTCRAFVFHISRLGASYGYHPHKKKKTKAINFHKAKKRIGIYEHFVANTPDPLNIHALHGSLAYATFKVNQKDFSADICTHLVSLCICLVLIEMTLKRQKENFNYLSRDGSTSLWILRIFRCLNCNE
ncbi:CLUMA_CG002937, isoform A [Clunio marinus]|uniref:CLUMA_CG002937, isoform A n=1 Tax=Clunio marinus TaxID=568069 RepID=A0A1J1HM76_9DIPT|nr:CLUMA_CG002937, isoform A [Clunio marinus]